MRLLDNVSFDEVGEGMRFMHENNRFIKQTGKYNGISYNAVDVNDKFYWSFGENERVTVYGEVANV